MQTLCIRHDRPVPILLVHSRPCKWVLSQTPPQLVLLNGSLVTLVSEKTGVACGGLGWGTPRPNPLSCLQAAAEGSPLHVCLQHLAKTPTTPQLTIPLPYSSFQCLHKQRHLNHATAIVAITSSSSSRITTMCQTCVFMALDCGRFKLYKSRLASPARTNH